MHVVLSLFVFKIPWHERCMYPDTSELIVSDQSLSDHLVIKASVE